MSALTALPTEQNRDNGEPSIKPPAKTQEVQEISEAQEGQEAVTLCEKPLSKSLLVKPLRGAYGS